VARDFHTTRGSTSCRVRPQHRHQARSRRQAAANAWHDRALLSQSSLLLENDPTKAPAVSATTGLKLVHTGDLEYIRF
jgi:hypothetical protein